MKYFVNQPPKYQILILPYVWWYMSIAQWVRKSVHFHKTLITEMQSGWSKMSVLFGNVYIYFIDFAYMHWQIWHGLTYPTMVVEICCEDVDFTMRKCFKIKSWLFFLFLVAFNNTKKENINKIGYNFRL